MGKGGPKQVKRQRHTPEQVIRKLRTAEQMLSEGKTAKSADIHDAFKLGRADDPLR